jgi:hypothetical protein
MDVQPAAIESERQVTAAERFAEQLRGLRAAVGDPSFRKMAGRSGRISHTTLHEAAAGTRFPSWETTREFVRACEADEAEWRLRWEDAQRTDVLDKVDLAPAAAEAPDAPRRLWWRWIAAAAAVVATAVIAVVGFTTRGHAPEKSAAEAPSAEPSGPLTAGDASQFVGDVTIPDGTRVKVNARFDKVWAIKNIGSVAWQHRFLAPVQPATDSNGCRVPSRTAIGDTAPGEQVMISVPVTAPSRPGRCWVGFKMVDEQGRVYFPSKRPVYFLVNVIA